MDGMQRIMSWRAVVLMSIVLVVGGAQGSPSFDCTKAQSAAEKEICRVTDLQWYDRQLTRLFKLAIDQTGSRNAVIGAQRAFLARRDACAANTDCIVESYEERLGELAREVNVYEAYASYRSKNGTLWIVRFGYDAAFKILTVGDNGHTCVFETDSATLGGKGVVRYGDANGVCRITVVPNDSEASLQVETKNCQDYCGMRAILDGVYKRAP